MIPANGSVFAIDERFRPALQQALAQSISADGMLDEQKLEAAFAAATPRTLPAGAVQTPAGRGVAVIPIQGGIFGEKVATIQSQLRAAAADPNIKAIVLDVNSPGGSVYGVDELASEIHAARAQKQIVAQVRPLAASAAYYLASQAHEIVGTPTSEMGSIGVWMMHIDASKALADMGINITLISAGKYKTEGHPFGALEPDARDFMQTRVDDYYGMFVDAVARGRGVSAARVRSGFGEGRVLGAKQAVALGMADGVATMEQTLARLDATQVQVMPAAAAASAAGADSIAATEIPIPATAERTQEEVNMPDPTPNSDAAANATKDANTRAATIFTLATTHNCADKAAAWVASGKSVEAVQAEILGGLQATARPLPGAPAVIIRKKDERAQSLVLGTIMRSLIASKGDMAKAARFAYDVLGSDKAAEHLEEQESGKFRALAASTGAAGGFWIPDPIADDFIELLRPMTAVRSLNPVLAPLVNGSLTLPGLAGGATATYFGEQQNVPKTDLAARQVKANAKKLGCVVPISNDLIRYQGNRADEIARGDMLRAVAQAEDSAFIRGAGTTYVPKGLRNWAPSANVFAFNTTVTLANASADMKTLKGKLEDGDCRMIRPGFIAHPRTIRYLEFVQDGNGNYVFRDEIRQGTLFGYPFRRTTLVPKNLGAGSDSEIYFCDFADVVIADVPNMVLEVSSEATYHDGTQLQSAWSRDESVVKVIVEHDLVVRHVESVAIGTTVQWT